MKSLSRNLFKAIFSCCERSEHIGLQSNPINSPSEFAEERTRRDSNSLFSCRKKAWGKSESQLPFRCCSMAHGPGGIRTLDPLLRRQVPYPLGYGSRLRNLGNKWFLMIVFSLFLGLWMWTKQPFTLRQKFCGTCLFLPLRPACSQAATPAVSCQRICCPGIFWARAS